MKVLYLANIPSPYRVDFFAELAKACALTVLFERKKASDRKAEWQSDATQGYDTHFLKGLSISNETAFAPSVLKFLKKNRFDIIVIGGYATPTAMLAILWLKLRKIPFVLNADGGFIKSGGGIKEKIKRYFIGAAEYWICSGDATKTYFVNYGADANKVFTFPFSSLKQADILSSPISKADKKAQKDALGITEPNAVLAVGQFIHRKGFDVLLNAWQGMPDDAGLYLVGDEPTEEYLKLVEDLNLKNVHFIGFLNKTALKNYYLACDLFILPTREDIWGLVVNEAFAHALPVVTTTACLAGLELVRPANGRLIPPDDAQQAHTAMTELLCNKKALADMQQQALLAIESYTIENMARCHIDIFKTILDK